MKNVLSAIPATLALLSLLSGSVFADAVRESARALHANAVLAKYANPDLRAE